MIEREQEQEQEKDQEQEQEQEPYHNEHPLDRQDLHNYFVRRVVFLQINVMKRYQITMLTNTKMVWHFDQKTNQLFTLVVVFDVVTKQGLVCLF